MIRSILPGFLCLLLLLPSNGSAQDRSEPRMVDADGTQLQVVTYGLEKRKANQPVVILQSGFATPMANWNQVIPGIAKFAPVIAYDRAGIGGSPFHEDVPTLERRSSRLRAMLENMGVEPPFVLVGHSWGGPLVHHFAATYPDEVTGLVMIDPTDLSRSTDSDKKRYIEAGIAEEKLDELDRHFNNLYDNEGSPPGLVAEWKVIQDMSANGSPDLLPPLPPLHLAIVAAGNYGTSQITYVPGFDYEIWNEIYWVLRREALTTLVSTAPTGRLIFAQNATHWIQNEDPQLIVDAVRGVVEPALTAFFTVELAKGRTYDSVLADALARYPEEDFDYRFFMNVGTTLLNRRASDQAIALFESYIDRFSGGITGRIQLATAYAIAERWDDAEILQQKIVSDLREQGSSPYLLEVLERNLQLIEQRNYP